MECVIVWFLFDWFLFDWFLFGSWAQPI